MSLANDPQFQAEAKAEQQFLDRRENKRMLESYGRSELIEMCLDLLENEKEMREILDKLQGIIR